MNDRNWSRLVVGAALVLGACGPGTATDAGQTSSETTSSTASDSSDSSDSTDPTDTAAETETETGDPEDDPCACAEDELCVATAYDSCTPNSGYTLECVPADPACVDAQQCDPDCLAAVCNSNVCPPPCGLVAGVDVWCAAWGPSFCDPLVQDCPEGEKCVPYSSQGTTWDANKCVPIFGDHAPGEACMSTGIIEATDDCAGDGVCWAVDPDTDLGTCTAFCEPDASCGPGQGCMISNNDSITLCFDSCSPHVVEDCGPDTVCLWTSDQYLCAPGVPFLDPGAVCGPGDVCGPGQTCVSALELDGCAGDSCCVDFCDTSGPDTCTPPHSCTPLFEPNQAPPGFETVGVCKLG